MVRKSPSINLVKSTVNILDRIVNWALSAGRVIVILTEIIALGAFLYRFSLDRQLIDIRSRIKQEQSVVNYLKDNENTYRNLQSRLTLSSTFAKEEESQVGILKDVVGFANNITFNTITISSDRIKIDAASNQVASLSDFVNALKKYSKIKSVLIDKVENRTSSASVNISLTANLK